jgi:hypothetical protein
MLEEMMVVKSIENYLKTLEFEIINKVESISSHGVDLIAQSPKTKTRLNVEAKGQTSSIPTTNRFGKEFTRNQKRDHLGKALLKSCEFIQKNEVGAIALPNDPVDRELIYSITNAIDRLGIIVFLVDENSAVTVFGKLPL